MEFADLGATTFTPSPIPGATNIMYQDKLVWSAIFEDGSTFEQYQNGEEKSSEAVSREKLRKFCLLTKQGKPFFIRELSPGWRFFYRRRTAIEQGGPTQVIHIVGWQIPISEDYLTQIAFVYEEDMSVVIGDIVLGKPQPILGRSFKWRYPIEFVAADHAIIT